MHVLIAEADASARAALQEALAGTGCETLDAHSLQEAQAALQAGAFDAVMCRVGESCPWGVVLLQWIGGHRPSTRMIAIADGLSPNERVEVAHAPDLHLLDSPVDPSRVADLVAQLGVRHGFLGAVEVELFDYVQMVAVSGRDKLIEVDTPEGPGSIWFEHGDIVHAEFLAVKGENAFYRLLSVGRGRFREKLYRPPPARSVMRSSTHLLMEAARRGDEGTLGSEIDDPAVAEAAVPETVDDTETSFEGLADESGVYEQPTDAHPQVMPPSATATPAVPDEISDDFVLPADDDDDADAFDPDLQLGDDDDTLLGDDDDVADPDPEDSVSGSRLTPMPTQPGQLMLDDPESCESLLAQFWEYEGVDGVALISSAGKVLAEDMEGQAGLITLAGFYMRGAARIARALGHNVFDGVIARSDEGGQMLIVSMGPASAVLSISEGYDPEVIRRAMTGA